MTNAAFDKINVILKESVYHLGSWYIFKAIGLYFLSRISFRSIIYTHNNSRYAVNDEQHGIVANSVQLKSTLQSQSTFCYNAVGRVAHMRAVG